MSRMFAVMQITTSMVVAVCCDEMISQVIDRKHSKAKIVPEIPSVRILNFKSYTFKLVLAKCSFLRTIMVLKKD